MDAIEEGLIEELRDEVAFLRRLTEHQAEVIAQLTARVPPLPQQDPPAGHPNGARADEKRSATAQRIPPSAWQRWREARAGLGASLTITGVVAGLAGLLLHVALRNQVIDTSVHLGYIIGLSGLLLLLAGLFIIF
ncbi:MAG TPA: hypothetical protein VKV26_21520 [Dehalococcoidia bacterium]|nr:hypothetical protein [Dehalococcoidia bacterium]